MSASSLSLPIFLRINFLISDLDSNRLTEHNRLTHIESFAEWQKASGRQFWLITHMIQSWTTLMAFPIASRRSSMFPEGNWQQIISILHRYVVHICHELLTCSQYLTFSFVHSDLLLNMVLICGHAMIFITENKNKITLESRIAADHTLENSHKPQIKPFHTEISCVFLQVPAFLVCYW